MPENLYGIDNLKKLIKFSCDITKQISTSSQDGWQWTDIFSFIDEFAELTGVVKSFPAISRELKDLTPEEKKELYDYLVAEFDIPNDKAEAAIENSLMQAISFIALYEMWKDLNKAA